MDPRCMTVTNLWFVTVTIKACLVTFSKGWPPAGPPEASLTRLLVCSHEMAVDVIFDVEGEAALEGEAIFVEVAHMPP